MSPETGNMEKNSAKDDAVGKVVAVFLTIADNHGLIVILLSRRARWYLQVNTYIFFLHYCIFRITNSLCVFLGKPQISLVSRWNPNCLVLDGSACVPHFYHEISDTFLHNPTIMYLFVNTLLLKYISCKIYTYNEHVQLLWWMNIFDTIQISNTIMNVKAIGDDKYIKTVY